MNGKSGSDPPARRYDDAEVRLLLERAARAQGTTPAAPAASGLTLTQLEEIATESHIDVARLRQAARELEVERAMRPTTTAARLAGAALRVQVERTLPFELDEEAFTVALDSIAAASDESGESRLVGRTLSWKASTHSGRRLAVDIAVYGGRTNIRIEERYGELAGGVFGGVLGGVGGGVGGAGAGIVAGLGLGSLAVAIPIVVVAGSYAACRAGFGAYVRRRAKRVEDLCDRVADDLTAWQERRS